jgi:hypothetical protein
VNYRRCPARRLDDDGALRAGVGDFGTWLPADNPERVFDGFSSTKREGMGIGLFIARAGYIIGKGSVAELVILAWRAGIAPKSTDATKI